MSRLLVVTTGSVALFLAAAQASAGPPPPPPPGAAPSGQARPAPSDDGGAPGQPGGQGGAPASDFGPPEDPFAGQRTASDEAKQSWSYSSGPETRPNFIRPERESILTINPIGFYQGVSIMGDHTPPFGATNTASAGAVLTWTGFERTASSSRVFFQLSSSVTPAIETESLRVTVRMPQTSVNVKNNRRRLDTSYFRTPVTEVRLKRHGSETVATLMLRREAVPQWSVIPAANGYQMLVLEFPDNPDLDTNPTQVGRDSTAGGLQPEPPAG